MPAERLTDEAAALLTDQLETTARARRAQVVDGARARPGVDVDGWQQLAAFTVGHRLTTQVASRVADDRWVTWDLADDAGAGPPWPPELVTALDMSWVLRATHGGAQLQVLHEAARTQAAEQHDRPTPPHSARG